MKYCIAAIVFAFTSFANCATLTLISDFVDNDHQAIQLFDLPNYGLSSYSVTPLWGGGGPFRLKSFLGTLDFSEPKGAGGGPYLGPNNELYILTYFWLGTFEYIDVAQNSKIEFQSQYDKAISTNVISEDLKWISFLGKKQTVYIYSTIKNDFSEFVLDGFERTDHLTGNFDFVLDNSGRPHLQLLSNAGARDPNSGAYLGKGFSLNFMNPETNSITSLRHPDYFVPTATSRPKNEFVTVKSSFLPADNTMMTLVGCNESDKIFFLQGDVNPKLETFNLDSSSINKFYAHSVLGMVAFDGKVYAVVMGSDTDAIYGKGGSILLHFLEVTKNGPQLTKSLPLSDFTTNFTRTFSDTKAPLLTLRNSKDEQLFFDMRDGSLLHSQPMGSKVTLDLKVKGSEIFLMSEEFINSDKHVLLEKLTL